MMVQAIRSERAAELLVGAAGALLLLTLLGFLVYQDVTEPATPPDISVHVEAIRQAEAGYLVEVRAENHGGMTAAGLVVRGTLSNAASTVETSHIRFQYVAPLSVRKGGLYFAHDPSTLALVVHPEGYEEP